MIFRYFKFSLFIFLLSIITLGCNNAKNLSESSDEIIYLNDFEWAESSLESTIEQAKNFYYSKFDITKRHNVQNIAGPEGRFVWLRTSFTLPKELTSKNIALCIPQIHFADQVFLNGSYIGQYGTFPESDSPKYKIGFPASNEPQMFVLDSSLLDLQGENYIYIKIYSLGYSFISKNSFIAAEETVRNYTKFYALLKSKIYILFIGITFVSFIVYLLLFLLRRKEGEYICFAILSFYSIFLLSHFCFSDFAHMFENVSTYLWTIKFLLCTSFYTIAYFLASFYIRFLRVKQNKNFILIRLFIWLFSTTYTLIQPTYVKLMHITPYMLILTFFPAAYCINEFYYLIKDKKSLKRAMLFLTGLSPFLLGAITDVTTREILEISSLPFFSIFGWITSMVIYITFLIISFARILNQNEYLTKNLQEEIRLKTIELSRAIKKLSDENDKTKTELKMAGIVQQKALPSQHRSFIGWDIAVEYSPLIEVSGDFYDYYNIGNILDGFCLFDVSGHGIASSLVTMIAKNIISQTFSKSRFSSISKSTNQLLLEINDKIIDSKGNIDNYLTGLIFKISGIDNKEVCHLEFSNAGHPHPLLYSDKDRTITELMYKEKSDQYGAIGFKDIAVSFQNVEFDMAIGDILVCYTDGLTESTNKNKEHFSKERLKTIVEKNHFMSAKEIQEILKEEFFKFLQDSKRDDDITVLILKRESSENFIEEISELNDEKTHNPKNIPYIPEL